MNSSMDTPDLTDSLQSPPVTVRARRVEDSHNLAQMNLDLGSRVDFQYAVSIQRAVPHAISCNQKGFFAAEIDVGLDVSRSGGVSACNDIVQQSLGGVADAGIRLGIIQSIEVCLRELLRRASWTCTGRRWAGDASISGKVPMSRRRVSYLCCT